MDALNRRRFLQAAPGAFVVGGTRSRRVGAAATQTSRSGELEWWYQTGDRIRSSPTVTDDTVLFGSFDGNLYAIERASGNERWRFESDDAAIATSPTVMDGLVFIARHPITSVVNWPDEGSVYAIDARTATEEWRFETDGAVYSSPTVKDETVFFGSDDDNVYAVDARTGEEEWHSETDSFIGFSSPTVVDGRVFIGSQDGNLYAIDTETGDEEWHFSIRRGISSPTVSDGTLFIGSGNRTVYALDTATGEEEWYFEADGGGSSPTVAGDTLFVGSTDDHLYAVDVNTGDEEWRFETGSSVLSSPTTVGDTVFVGSDDGNVYALDTTTGDEKWYFETGDKVVSSPTVVDGTLFVGSYDGSMYALNAGVSGSSEDSRVRLETLGHRYQGSLDYRGPDEGLLSAFSIADLAAAGAVAGGALYFAAKRTRDDETEGESPPRDT